MAQGFQNQATEIQIKTNTSNTGTINEDITTHVTPRRQLETSKPDMKKRAKAMVYASTTQIGASLLTFGERLTRLNEVTQQDEEMSGTNYNTPTNNNTMMEKNPRYTDPCNRQGKNKNVQSLRKKEK